MKAPSYDSPSSGRDSNLTLRNAMLECYPFDVQSAAFNIDIISNYLLITTFASERE
jgi:hypothetical protein